MSEPTECHGCAGMGHYLDGRPSRVTTCSTCQGSGKMPLILQREAPVLTDAYKAADDLIVSLDAAGYSLVSVTLRPIWSQIPVPWSIEAVGRWREKT